MEELKLQGFSQVDWQDLYYDGLEELCGHFDYWGFEISKDDKGYIEDASDDWYLDVMSGKIERMNSDK